MTADRSGTWYPVSFEASAPASGTEELLAERSIRLLVDFFRAKGLAQVKAEDRQEDWYQDWISYQAAHGIYASLLSPARYSARGHRFGLRELTRFLEVAAYFSPAHAYSLHVSFLGLFPILMGTNETLKVEAVARLEGGGLFAFAVSEKAHGSDLFSNEFSVRRAGPGRWIAEGAKYYIGNANAACMVSILARSDAASSGGGRRAPFVFFAVRPAEAPGFRSARKIRTLGIRTAFVGEFEVQGHEFPESDVISAGRDAWDAVFGTVDLGKFLLGFGAIGICEHAFAESVGHMHARTLYGRRVTELPHIRATTVVAFARLVAMKFYAHRALDYLQAAAADERRYLLYNAVQKARVSTEGVKVIGLLSECIGARGAEAETYFESALRDAQLVPGLEGSTHINFGLTAQFVGPYFDAPGGDLPPSPPAGGAGAGPDENPYWTASRDRNAKTVRFGPYLAAYEPLRDVPNVRVFLAQVETFKRFVQSAGSMGEPAPDSRTVLAVGRCFAIVAFAQLVAERCAAVSAAPWTVALVFHALVSDLAGEALALSATTPVGSPLREILTGAVRVPETSAADYDGVWALLAERSGIG